MSSHVFCQVRISPVRAVPLFISMQIYTTKFILQILIANAYRPFYCDVSVLRVWRWRSSGTWRRVTYWTIHHTTWRHVRSHRSPVPSLYNLLSIVLIAQTCTCDVECWDDHWCMKWNGFRTKRRYTIQTGCPDTAYSSDSRTRFGVTPVFREGLTGVRRDGSA